MTRGTYFPRQTSSSRLLQPLPHTIASIVAVISRSTVAWPVTVANIAAIAFTVDDFSGPRAVAAVVVA